MHQYQTLIFNKKANIAIITLNRPDAANGVNTMMADELLEVSSQCKTDGDIKAVLLNANGKFFSAGGDIRHMVEFGDEAASRIKAMADLLHRSITNFTGMDAPLIIAVNGVAAGGGFSLAISGDLVVAAESAVFTMAYTRAGLSPDLSSSYFLPRLIGLRRAQDMAFTNRLLSANEALEWGLIHRVVADNELQQKSLELAEEIAQGSLGANSRVKKLFAMTWHNNLQNQMDAEAEAISASLGSVDGQEGIAAFLEKRKPVFE